MRVKVSSRQGLRLAVCLTLGLAGCRTSFQGQSQPVGDLSGSENRYEAADETPTQRTGREPPTQLEADRRFDGAVRLTQFETLSDVEQPREVPPPPFPPVVENPAGQDGRVAGEDRPSPAQALLQPRLIDDAMGLTAGEPERAENICELDLTTALTMVSGQNPQVAFAGQRYREAYARLEAARALWLPSIRAGVSYNKHEGVLQSSTGRVFDSSRGSLQSGLGVRSVGTGSPPVPGLVASFHLTDAIFQPRIANRAAAARQEAARATTHEVLLDTALAYIAVLQAAEEQAIAEETLQHAQQLANLTATFARTGQGSQADADRARAELVVRTNDVTRTEEKIKVASARLNELLHLDATTIVVPRESTIVPIELVAGGSPLGELLATGLTNRPELAESRHLVCEAVQRYRREKLAPLLPSAFLGVSYGEFGGGPGSNTDVFRDRFDFDLAAYWEVRNIGFGESAAREEMRARYQQARLREVQVMDRVAREIVEAHAQVQSRHKQIAVAESGVQAATDSYKRNTQRIREGVGLPIEVLQAIQALDQARREYLRTLVQYDQAQFRLHRALGWPIQ